MFIKSFQLLIITTAIIFNACTRESKVIITFTNPLDIERTGEVITLGNNELTSFTGDFPENKLPLFLSGKDTLTAQFINLNNNGAPAEILVEIDLGPKESKNVTVKFIPADSYPVFPKKTNIRFARKSDVGKEIMTDERMQTFDNRETSAVFQMEGPAWENDKVGFRNYFDFRNGMDIFGKTTPEMVLDGVGLGDNYHKMADWGMDILKVGNSLGAGAIGIEHNGKLYRIGDNGASTFERIYEGPLRSEFRFVFPEWEMESEKYHITHYVTITAGEYAFKSTVIAGNLPQNAHLISGIVTMLSDATFIEMMGDYACLFTHDTQAENKEFLAMALMIPKKYFKESGEAPNSGPGIIETYFGKMSPGNNDEVEYHFYSLWENSDNGFADPDYVKKLLREEANKLTHLVTLGRIK